ncbi:MAG: translocation/assembly module TamB domain-containing protein [Bacteroidales bacterium]|nr:translocation/assembly module TamB domain-containing protein [Bacteroidales bacterium]
MIGFLLLDLTVVGLLFVPAIQTYAVNKITQSISEKWGTELSIKDVHITPTLKLVAHDVCIQDTHHKDMIRVSTVKGRLLSFTIKPLKLKFGNLDLDHADVVLRKYAGEENANISLWAKNIKKEKKKKGTFLLTARNLRLTDSRFVLINDNCRVVFDTKGHPDIDYGYLELADIDWKSEKFIVSANKLVNISTDFKHLAFNQYGGFSMTDCQGQFSICDTALIFDKMNFKTPNSKMDMDLKFAYSDWKKLGDFVDSVRITSTIRPSQLCMKDVAGFAPALKGMDETFMLKASRFDGTVNDFRLIDFYAHWGLGTQINGDLALENITDFSKAHINVQLDSSQVNIPELAAFHLPHGKVIRLNKTINKFGQTKIKGSFVGSPSVFDASFDFNTALGPVLADLSTFIDNGALQIDGTVSSPNFNLASLTNNHKVLGTTDLFLAVEGDMKSAALNKENFKTLQAHISGDISRIYLYGYNLRNTNIEADYQNKLYTCELTSNDKHLDCDISAELDMRDEFPNLRSTISLDHFDAGDIANALAKVDSATAKGFEKIVYAAQSNPKLKFGFDNLTVALRGNNLNNVNGYAGCDNIRIYNDKDSLENERFRLTTINTDIAHKFIFSSNVVNASLETNYDVQDIKDSLQNIAHNFLPTLIAAGKQSKKSKLDLAEEDESGYIKVHLNTYRTRSVMQLLFPDLILAPNSNLDMTVSSDNKDNIITANIPFFVLRDKVAVYRLNINGNTEGDQALRLHLVSDSAIAILKDSRVAFKSIDAQAQVANDTILYNLNWLNDFNGSEANSSTFSGYADVTNHKDIVLGLRNSGIYLNNNKWEFNNENNIHIQKGAIAVNNLRISDSSSTIQVDGTYNKTHPELMTVKINDVDLSVLNPLTAKIDFGGELSANVNISSRNGKMFLFGKALANRFVCNEERLGNVFLFAVLDTTNKVSFNGGVFESKEKFNSNILNNYNIRDFQKEDNIVAKVNGNYDQKKFTVHTTFDDLNAGFLEPFLSGFSDHFDGKASGKLNFYATPDSSYFDGTVHADDINIGIAPLGMSYIVQNQDIRFNSQGIFFDNMLIKDNDGNTAYMNGSVRHKMFKDMKIGLKITTDRVMVLNTPKTPTSVFYGIGYAAGDVYIEGEGNNISFTGPNLTTLEGTKIYLQVSSANSASQSNIIHFKPKETDQNSNEISVISAKNEEKTSLSYDFTFNVTNEADVVLLLESIGGTMNARADGKFQLTYNDNDNLNLYGSLLLHSGDFRLALYNVVNSKFTLVPGGSILFDGPLENMTVNASAYKSSKTSLSNIVPQEYLSGNGVNVNAYLHLNGPLMQHIDPTFSFELPNSSNEVRNLFYTSIDTGNVENITKQFVYFMVTNNFMPNDMFSSDRAGSGLPGLNLFSNIVNNMLSNMISNKNGSFGITYNQATETSSAEYGVKAGANLLKDRVTLETSIGYYDDKNTQGFNNMYGDFSVEYNINKAGTWKLKAYTYVGERDENYIYDAQINYTAGVAVAFKQDFNSTPRRKNKSNPKQRKNKKDEQH